MPGAERLRAFFGPGTRDAVINFQRAQGLPITGVVDAATASAINRAVEARLPFVVKGEVRQTNGDIYAGATVRAFNKNLRNEDWLSETKTNAAGHYEIRYSAEQFRGSNEKEADLIVRVFDDTGNVLVASPVFFDAHQNKL